MHDQGKIDADLGEPTTVIMVRHGRTEDTDRGRIRGRDSAGPGLNPAGRAEVQRLAEILAGGLDSAGLDSVGLDSVGLDSVGLASVGPPQHLIASPLLRAQQTAVLLADPLQLEPQPDDAWAELALGDWDGLGYAEIADRWPQDYHAWRGSTAIAPPNGESLDDVANRVAAACARLISQHPAKTVLVVSHTAPIRTVIATALDAGPAALWRLRIDPARLSVVRFWADGGCEVGCVNCLAGLNRARVR